MYIFASDLDQTLIFSKNFNAKNMPEINLEKLIPIEFLEGAEISFISPSALKLLTQISKEALFIPATTRTIEQFNRVLLKENNIAFDYAITSNGGNILINGKPDLQWNQNIRKNIKDNCPPFEAVHKKLQELNNKYNFLISGREADELFCYFIIQKEKLPDEEVSSLIDYFGHCNFNISLQGRKLYIIPRFVDKALALEEIKKYVGKFDKIISAGDSLLDLPMLKSSDIGLIPSHGEIVNTTHNQLQYYSNLIYTNENDYYACEEILSFVLKNIQ